jgi:hypothetical protein
MRAVVVPEELLDPSTRTDEAQVQRIVVAWRQGDGFE